jgi:hypothetical protein
MEVKTIYKYGVFPVKDKDLEFELKCIEIECKGKGKYSFDYEKDSFYYTKSEQGGTYEICLARELDSNKFDIGGFLYFSKPYENKKELTNKIINYIETTHWIKFKKEVYSDGTIDDQIDRLTCVWHKFDEIR